MYGKRKGNDEQHKNILQAQEIKVFSHYNLNRMKMFDRVEIYIYTQNTLPPLHVYNKSDSLK